MTATVCKFHPDVIASEICDKCHAPICVNDIRRLTRGRIIKIYCPNCEQALKRRDRKLNLVLWIIVIAFFLSFAILVLYTRSL